jgi:hypothetical protein
MLEELRASRAIRTDDIIVKDQRWLGAGRLTEGEGTNDAIVGSFHRLNSISDRLRSWNGSIALTDGR